MIVLDTNVVSEAMRRVPEAQVLQWLDRQAPETLFLTTTSLAELVSGIALLPLGKRRSGLHATLSGLLRELFSGRVLPFDEPAALAYRPLVARVRSAGHAIAIADAQIAAIAEQHGLSVATRDATPFRAAGVQVLDPWQQ